MLRAYSHETLEIEKDFYGIPEIYGRETQSRVAEDSNNHRRQDPMNIVILKHSLSLDRKNQFSFPGMTAKIRPGR